MPRPRSLKPAYCIEKATNRAFVCIGGQKRYLGAPDSRESRDGYDRLIGQWIARARMPAPEPVPRPPPK